MYKYLSKTWKQPAKSMGNLHRNRVIKWRGEPALTRIDKPTRLDRARSLGYKAKQGTIVVRVRLNRGSGKSPKRPGGRKPSKAGMFFTVNKSKQQVAEEKAARGYKNAEVLNSYWVGQDGKNVWYEVILADTNHPAVKRDKDLRWLVSGKHKGRATRGLTTAGRKSRGILHKGKKG
jgi:large subunit ribosomal protein L15e